MASTSVPTSQTFRRQDVHNQFRYGIDISDSTGRGPNGMEITSLDGGVNTKAHVQNKVGRKSSTGTLWSMLVRGEG